MMLPTAVAKRTRKVISGFVSATKSFTRRKIPAPKRQGANVESRSFTSTPVVVSTEGRKFSFFFSFAFWDWGSGQALNVLERNIFFTAFAFPVLIRRPRVARLLDG